MNEHQAAIDRNIAIIVNERDLYAAGVRRSNGLVMPAGEYLVGDPCYGVPGERWSEWLTASDPDVFGDNPVLDAQLQRVLIAPLDGHPVLGIGTAHGDGQYEDQHGAVYPVDSGLIGLVPVGLVSDPISVTGMQRVTFGVAFECLYDDGVIYLGDLAIDTNDQEEEDEWGAWDATDEEECPDNDEE